MIKNITISALLLSASVAHAVTIGAQNTQMAPSEHRVVQQKTAQQKTMQTAPQKKVVRKVVKRKKTSAVSQQTVKVVHHHHYYHPRVEQDRRYQRRQVYYHSYRQPVRVVRSQRFQSRGFYPAPQPGVGLHYVLR